MIPQYIIRNDLQGHSWTASAGEARLYAIGGEMDYAHSVFLQGGGGTPLAICDI